MVWTEWLKMFFMYMVILAACISLYHVHATHGSQKRALNHLELELQMIINCYVGSGN